VDWVETGGTEPQARGLGRTPWTNPATLPRLGSRVRIPSSAPNGLDPIGLTALMRTRPGLDLRKARPNAESDLRSSSTGCCEKGGQCRDRHGAGVVLAKSALRILTGSEGLHRTTIDPRTRQFGLPA
jgi:hypothetical protein